MLDDISPAVERALEAARARSAPGPLDAAHLALALLADDEGRAAQLVLTAGATLEAVRNGLTAHVPIPFEFPAILTAAREIAGERDETTVTGEYLLLGLLRALEPLQAVVRSAGADLGGVLKVPDLPVLRIDEPLDLRDPADHVNAARVVDANANRAREALRVLDDYCRFVLDDALLTEEVKATRHALVEILNRVPAGVLIEARDTAGDVGTGITAAGEMVRGSPAEVARVNLKRLQEALRSLEEFGKLLSADLAAGFEAVRYRAYTLERTLSTGGAARERLAGSKLYVLLTGKACTAALDWTIREAADGGADIFQLREKDLTDRELIERARHVRRWTRETRTLFIMNDRPDIARLVEADGVHLGQDDMSVRDARRVLGPGPLIGVSTHTPEQVRRAVLDGASYIGVGPVFPSSTKAFARLAGREFIQEAAALTTLPAFAIGGINLETIVRAVAAGARRVAVSAVVCTSENPAATAAGLRAVLP
ncbi:MAG TPA: thiamine phosphate synthase [Gemmataceae bacterium]|nr:thiamine phosphate synthase [Gemmataceae bacterium]